MELQSFFTVCLFFSSALSGFLALYGAHHFRTPGARSYIGLMCSVMLYCFGYMLEINQTTVEGVFFSLRIEYLGIAFLPAFWVLLAVRYTGYGETMPGWFYKSLFVIPVTTVILFNTNSLHHLHYTTFTLNLSGPFPVAQFTKGIWYHVNLFYMDVCFFVGNLVFLRMLLRSAGQTRKQAATMFGASIIPWVGDFIYQAGLAPYGIDIVTFTFSLVGPLFGLALFRFRMFDFVPIARHTVFDYMKDPVLVLDATDRLADFNRPAAAVFAALSPKAIGDEVQRVLHAQPELLRAIAEQQAAPEELRIVCKNAAHVFELSCIPIIAKSGQFQGRILILHDVTQQKQLLEQLREQATRDGLTGIFNHRYFMELSEKTVAQMIRYNHPASLIIVDLDYFKRINDSYGHLAGDEVLKRTAGLFQSMLRESDILGRYGGEEFVFFLPETSPEAGRRMAERLRTALAGQKLFFEDREITITGSFGVSGCLAASACLNLEHLCKKADEALYRAKAKGRNRVELELLESVTLN